MIFNNILTIFAMKNKKLKSIKLAIIFVIVLVTVYYLTLGTNEYMVCAEQADHIASQNEVIDIKETVDDELTPEKKEKREGEISPDDILFIAAFHLLLITCAMTFIYIGYNYKP
jgi:hypothetical protein